MWFEKLSTFLKNLHYKPSHHDHSLFIKHYGSLFIIVLIYVDDLILAGNNTVEITALKRLLDKKIKIKDFGPLHYFLGLEISRSKEGIFLNQRKYMLDLINSCDLLAGKLVQSPMIKDSLKNATETELFPEPERYRRLIGKIIYLTTTTLEIEYAVNQLSKHMHKPHQAHYHATIKIIHYMKNDPGQGLLYRNNSKLCIKAYSDADWATCPITRHSVTGYCVFLGDSLISWKCKKQSTVSRSSFEAEYRALSSTVCEIQCLTYLLKDFRVPFTSHALLFCDNESARHIVQNSVFHERTKHIEIDYHVVCERLQ
jgi:hypothetical protein